MRTRMRSAGRLGAAWLVAAVLAACGSERSVPGAGADGGEDASIRAGAGTGLDAAPITDGGVPDFTSTFAAETLVSELSDDEVLALCNELDAWANTLYAAIEGDLCEFAGLFVAALLPGDPVENCEEQAAMCLASTTESTTACDVAQAGSCGATVAEIEACLDAAKEAFVTTFGALDCSLAADPNAVPAGGPAPPVTPDACTLLDGKCPGISIMPPMPGL